MRKVGELFSLTSRTALVTGGSGHLGRAIGETLLELGARVVITDLPDTRGEERALELCRGTGRDDAARFIACDLLQEAATRDLVHAAAAWLGGLDIIIHNAAYTGASQVPGWAAPFAQQTVQAFDAAGRVNATAAFILAQEAAPLLRASPAPSLIFIGSIYALVGPQWELYRATGMANPLGYNVSKAGLLQMARYLATALAPVRVNCISPGGIARDQPEQFRARYAARTPLGRLATEEDFKGALAFLASGASAYVTGHNLVVDGGWCVW